MDARAYVPLRPSDLDQGVGRQVGQLQQVIDGVHDRLKGSKHVKPWSVASHGRIFYGWYARSRKTEKKLWFGFFPRAWSQHGITPLWMQVRFGENGTRQTVEMALSPLRLDGQPGLFDDSSNSGFLVPLNMPPYAGLEEVQRDLLAQIERVGQLLDAAAPVVATPEDGQP